MAAAAGVVFALAGDETEPQARPKPAPGVAAPAMPDAPASSPAEPSPPGEEPPPARSSVPPRQGPTPLAPASPAPAPAPAAPSPSVSPSPSPSREKPAPTPSPSQPPPKPSRSPAKPPQGFPLARLDQSAYGDHSGPEVQTWRSSWVWQRWGLQVGDRRFAHGITVNSRSSVEIALNRQCTTFSAQAGVDGLSMFTDGSVRFSVYADGQRLWQSAALGYRDPPASVQVSLTGRKTLRLVVERAGQGSLPTLVSWADAEISCR